MANDPARVGYAYRYAQGKVAAANQRVPTNLTAAQRDEWVRGWNVADRDHAAGRASRLPVAPPAAPTPKAVVVKLPPEPAPAPPAPPEPPPAPPPEPPPAASLRDAPRIVKAKVKATEPAAPAAPVVVLANKAPPAERPPPWLLLRVYRDEGGFRIDSEGSDATVAGNGVSALATMIAVHLRLRLGPDEDEWMLR